MNCPRCKVYDSRVVRTVKGTTNRRQRQCACGVEWYTTETIDRGSVREMHGVPRVPIPVEVIAAVLARDGRMCRYCGTTEGTIGIDHVTPLCAEIPSGVSVEVETAKRNSPDNLVACCGRCNSAKGDRVDGKRQSRRYIERRVAANSRPIATGSDQSRQVTSMRASDPESVSDLNLPDPEADQTRRRARERTRDGGAATVGVPAHGEAGRSAERGSRGTASPGHTGSNPDTAPLPPNGFRTAPPAKAITVLMPDGSGSPLWTAAYWFERYRLAWRERYNGTFYAGKGIDADARATGGLADALASLDPADLLTAQGRAPQMFQEFLADASPQVVQARHPWSWFVVRWNGLRVAPAPRQRLPSDDGLARRTDAKLAAMRVDPAKLATAEQIAALRREANHG